VIQMPSGVTARTYPVRTTRVPLEHDHFRRSLVSDTVTEV
jgi:hypothetical protein